jgi:hypothetical protein
MHRTVQNEYKTVDGLVECYVTPWNAICIAPTGLHPFDYAGNQHVIVTENPHALRHCVFIRYSINITWFWSVAHKIKWASIQALPISCLIANKLRDGLAYNEASAAAL